MVDYVVFKRLTLRSDLGWFKSIFHKHELKTKQKGIGLNKEIINQIWPSLVARQAAYAKAKASGDTMAAQKAGHLPIHVEIHGPAAKPPIISEQLMALQDKNWRLTGPFIEEPTSDKHRFDLVMEEGDYALIGFNGIDRPNKAIVILLAHSTSDAALLADLPTLPRGSGSMVRIEPAALGDLATKHGLPEGHAIRLLLVDSTGQEAVGLAEGRGAKVAQTPAHVQANDRRHHRHRLPSLVKSVSSIDHSLQIDLLRVPMQEIIVLRRADATPHAAALIEGLRDIGYSLETAIADVVDNSITAGAHTVQIVTETYSDEPYIAIIDDGEGMTEEELISAMRPGSRNPLITRDEPDLGRFGLGLKSASFSQSRRLTVVSRTSGQTSAAIWDLDDVAKRNEWAVQLPDRFDLIPGIHKLGSKGTLVLWQKLDRLIGSYSHSAAKRAEVINQRIAETERHLRLVFHRFIEESRSLRISLNGRHLRPLDPFARKNSATIADPEEKLTLFGRNVEIQSFTLPHHKHMGKTEWEDIGGPEGHLKTQGFYLYRGKRLILHGTWFGLCRQSELTKLSRVRIDIPNSMDADWKIDVKKSSAQLPPVVRDRLKKVIERILIGSKRTYAKRGQKLVDHERLPMWHRIQADGQIRYRPNIKHPAFADFAESLPPDLRRGFINCIALVGASLPIETLHADMAGAAELIVPDRVDEDTLVQAVQATLSVLLGAGKDIKTIIALMQDVDPFRSAWDDTQRIITATIEAREEK